MPDSRRLIAEVAARNGVRIDPDDPAFCLVTLNELVLQEAKSRIVEEVRASAEEFANAAEKIQVRSGTIIARQINEALTSAQDSLKIELQTLTDETAAKLARLHLSGSRYIACWIAMGITLTVAVFVAGILVGWSFR